MFKKLSLFAIAIILSIGPSHAQLIASSDEPIDITGDAAEFKDNIAVWTGSVRVVQGEAVMTAERLEARLNDQREFQSIVALGSVRYSNGKEAITGERADYDELARTITISENVIVTQGKQVMTAGAVTYWIDTGKIKFAPEPGKRIRGIFYTGKDKQI